jgi:hypothetical protein
MFRFKLFILVCSDINAPQWDYTFVAKYLFVNISYKLNAKSRRDFYYTIPDIPLKSPLLVFFQVPRIEIQRYINARFALSDQ